MLDNLNNVIIISSAFEYYILRGHAMDKKVAIIGGGLAGCEAAFSLAQQGVKVTLCEMKPSLYSPAHSNPNLAELVCSNSFRSDEPDAAVGCLKNEMRLLQSITMMAAEKTKIPAGKALAVDRDLFSSEITNRIEKHSKISIVREEVRSLFSNELENFDAIILAAGPLASDSIVDSLKELTGHDHLYFYDAIAPVVERDSVNMDIAFWGGRYEPESTDYLNCPFTEVEYQNFYKALLAGKKAPTHDFEEEKHFEACMPIESLAERGEKTLTFGSLKPVGFVDPRTGERPFALLQLRAENLNKSMFNLVGCQTKLIYSEQERIFRMVPGLEKAEFVRFGSMHRNTFVNAPESLNADLSLKKNPKIFLAGQITGVEGYVESAACGLWVGLSIGARLNGKEISPPPVETALGSLLGHLSLPTKRFQPSNVQFGLMPSLKIRARKSERRKLYAKRAEEFFNNWLNTETLKSIVS